MLLDEKETSGSGLFDVNMTPLIDVSLVLVITLMLMTPLALESNIFVRNQKPVAATDESERKTQRLHLQILSEDLVLVENRTLKRDQVHLVLGAMLRQPQYSGVALSCADNVSHATFVNVLDQAKMSGGGNIAISDESFGQ